jgi:hypothetical protein
MGVRVGVLSCWTMLVQQYLFGYHMFFFWPLLWTDMFALLITVYIMFVLHMFLKQRQQAPAAISCAVWVSCCYLQVWVFFAELWMGAMCSVGIVFGNFGWFFVVCSARTPVLATGTMTGAYGVRLDCGVIVLDIYKLVPWASGIQCFCSPMHAHFSPPFWQLLVLLWHI